MAGLLTTAISIIRTNVQKTPSFFLAPVQLEVIRNRNSKHWNPKFKKERKAKVIGINKLLFRQHEEMTPEENRALRKMRGIMPMRPWVEKGITINCSNLIFEAYVPPEGDGKFSITSKTGMKQNVLAVGKKTTSMMAIRKIKSFLGDFHPDDFVEEARDIYVNAHKALAEKDYEKMRDFVTEKTYGEMTHNAKNKQIRWNFIESLEPARVVRARVQKSDIASFAQLTVRFHTKQSLAIYDRFGRLMHGSEFIGKDVLEYIVFERSLSYDYGSWRIHGKIIPTWQAPLESSPTTAVKPPERIEENEISSKVSTVAESQSQEPITGTTASTQ